MPHSAALVLRGLAFGELFLTVVALAACLRLRAHPEMRAMRDYLAVRLVSVLLACIAFLLRSFPAVGAEPVSWLYFWAYWISLPALVILLLRVTGATLLAMLRPFAGLSTLAAVIRRWLQAALLFLVLPTALVAVAAFRKSIAGILIFRLTNVLGMAQLIPLAAVIGVGTRFGLSPRTRHFGLLVGLSLEPATDLAIYWFPTVSFWSWDNLIRQIVTDCVLILWTVYFLRPEPDRALSPPSATLQRWDLLARKALPHRLPPVGEPESSPHGGRPWPSSREF
jgi:hypothetical protein